MKPSLWNLIPRVFFPFALIWKLENASFERNWTTFVKPAFSASLKSPPKMVVWNRLRGIGSQGCFFVSLRWEKSNKGPPSTRLFALLVKAHPKWWYETDLVAFDPRVLFRFAPMGKVEKSRSERIWTTFVNPAFCAAWNSPPKMVV